MTMKLPVVLLILAAMFGGAGCASLMRKEGPSRAQIQEWVAKLSEENPFVYADARNRLIGAGCAAVPELERAALAPLAENGDGSRRQRNALNLLGELAKREDCRLEVRKSLVNIAVEAPDIIALGALHRLETFEREATLLDLIRVATGPDARRRERARVVIFGMDKKGGVDLMLDLLSGERKVGWYRHTRETVRESFGDRWQRRLSWLPLVEKPARRIGEPDPREERMVEALRRWTYEDMGYDPAAPEEDRVAAIERWRAWWRANRKTYDKKFKLEDYLPLIREMEAYQRETE